MGLTGMWILMHLPLDLDSNSLGLQCEPWIHCSQDPLTLLDSCSPPWVVV